MLMTVDASALSGEAAGLKGDTRIEELTRVQRTIVRRTAEARATVPDLELDTDVDMESCLELTSGRECSVTAILVRVCALALRDVPHANSAYRDGRFELYSRVNVGVTIETTSILSSRLRSARNAGSRPSRDTIR